MRLPILATTAHNWLRWAKRLWKQRGRKKSSRWPIAAIITMRKCSLARERAFCLACPRRKPPKIRTKGAVRSDRRDNIDHYRNLTACPACALKPKCTPNKVKRVKRWEHEGV